MGEGRLALMFFCQSSVPSTSVAVVAQGSAVVLRLFPCKLRSPDESQSSAGIAVDIGVRKNAAIDFFKRR